MCKAWDNYTSMFTWLHPCINPENMWALFKQLLVVMARMFTPTLLEASIFRLTPWASLLACLSESVSHLHAFYAAAAPYPILAESRLELMAVLSQGPGFLKHTLLPTIFHLFLTLSMGVSERTDGVDSDLFFLCLRGSPASPRLLQAPSFSCLWFCHTYVFPAEYCLELSSQFCV